MKSENAIANVTCILCNRKQLGASENNDNNLPLQRWKEVVSEESTDVLTVSNTVLTVTGFESLTFIPERL